MSLFNVDFSRPLVYIKFMLYEEVFIVFDKKIKKNKSNKGFAFKPDINYIKETMNMPARARLEWLEEVNAFIYKALPKSKIKIWEKVKRGHHE